MRNILAVAMGLAVVLVGLVQADGPATTSAVENAIADQIARLGSNNKDEHAAAVQALVKTGRPAMPLLVKALDDPANDLRAGAAEAIRSILAADPAAAPNWHDEAYWQKRITQVKKGMSLDEALKILLPDVAPAERDKLMEGGAWSGGSGFSMYRLDDYWTVTLQLVSLGREQVAEAPSLRRSARPRLVQPPATYTGAWVNWFVNGQMAYEIHYRNGKYDGTFTSYHDDGGRAVEQHYKDGVCDGADSGWYRSGKKMYEGQYKDGKQEGRWQHWFENGQPQSIEDYSGGQQNGVYANWHENGQKHFEEHYQNGKKEGLDSAWDEQGKVLWVRTFRNGELVESK